MGLLDNRQFARGLLTPSGNPVGRWIQGVAQRTMHPIEALADVAQQSMSDPMGTALNWSAPMAGSMAGIFAGVGAKTADVARLGLAQELKAKGMPDAEIWKQTGWTNAYPDGKWRFEIPDNAAKWLTPSKWETKTAGGARNMDIQTALPHEQLYSAYPEVGQTNFSPSAPLSGGQGAFTGNMIQVDRYADAPKSVGIHELQHAIQQREGFAKGGSPGAMRQLVELDNIVQGKQPPTDADVYNVYQRLAGEAEARLTQARMNLTPEQRLAQYPYDPEYFQKATGVPINDLIVRNDGSIAAMKQDSEPLVNTIGLPNRGRDLIQSKAEEYAQKLRDAGVNVMEVVHSGSLAGPSSYIKIHGFPDIRISGHSKGVFNSQDVINIGNDAAFEDLLTTIPKTVRKVSPEEMAQILEKQKQDEIATMYPIRIKNGLKKLAKGKSISKSEQEAIDWFNAQGTPPVSAE